MATPDITQQLGSAVDSLATDIGTNIGGMAKNVTGNIASAIDSVTSATDLLSTARKMLLPLGGSVFKSVLVDFLGPENAKDWRVRLSIPFNFFMGSAIFAPLVDAGGLVFPYTPSINISHSAEYDEQAITHQNYPFLAYKHSKPGEIQITAPFYVEDASQAQYWIAVVHFLRSVTKMYTGDSSEQGSPPPILSLNAYGDHVFKKVPVVVTSFDIRLDEGCDYISTKATAGFSTNIKSQVVNLTQLDSSGGNLIGGLVSGGVSSLLGLESHVPTKSTISVTLKTIYSREAVRQFSLQSFVNGTYIAGGFV